MTTRAAYLGWFATTCAPGGPWPPSHFASKFAVQTPTARLATYGLNSCRRGALVTTPVEEVNMASTSPTETFSPPRIPRPLRFTATRTDHTARTIELPQPPQVQDLERGPSTPPRVRLPYPTWVLMFAADLSAVALSALVSGAAVAQLVAVGALTLALVWCAGLYRPRLELSALDDLPALLGRALVAVGVAALALLLLRQPSSALSADFARATLVLLLALPVGRGVAYAVVRMCRRRRLVAHRTLIAGGGTVAARLAEALTVHPEYGLEPVAFLDPNPLPQTRPTLPVLSPTLLLADAIRQ